MSDLIMYRKLKSLKEQHNSIASGNIFEQAEHFVKHIVMARDRLQYDLKIFSRENEIWLDQCDSTILSISEMNIPLQNLCKLLDDGSSLPVIVTATQSSNELAISLEYTYKQLNKLIEHITAFGSICRKSPKQARSKRKEIARKFELCMQSIDDILQQIHSLLQKPQQNKPNYTCLEVEDELPGIDQPYDKDYDPKHLPTGKEIAHTRSGREMPAYLKPVIEENAPEDVVPEDELDARLCYGRIYDLP